MCGKSWETCTATMLIGEYTHQMDEKNRLSFPAKFRTEIGKRIIITKGLDSCLFVYPMKSWQKIFKKIGSIPLWSHESRSISRHFMGGATEVEFDEVGRILIPDFLKAFASLKDKVVFVGVNDRIEAWDAMKWDVYKKRAEREADSLAEKLGSGGNV